MEIILQYIHISYYIYQSWCTPKTNTIYTSIICQQKHCMLSHFSPVDSLWPYGLWPTRLLCPWNSPGKNAGVSCHTLLQGIFQTRTKPGLLHSLCLISFIFIHRHAWLVHPSQRRSWLADKLSILVYPSNPNVMWDHLKKRLEAATWLIIIYPMPFYIFLGGCTSWPPASSN